MKYLKLSSILTLFFKTSILFTSTSYLPASLSPILLPEAVKNKKENLLNLPCSVRKLDLIISHEN